MKILMVHPHDVLTSPWTIRIIKLAENLQSLGHSVDLYYFIEHQRRKEGYQTSMAEHYSLPMTCLRKYRIPSNIIHFIKKCKKADIIHIQKCFAHVAIPALISAYLSGTPVHYDWDDWEEGITIEYLGNHVFTRLVTFYERSLPGLVDSISISSNALRQRAIDLNFPEDNIVKVPVGADPDEFSPDCKPDRDVLLPEGNGPLVVYAGQIEGANYAALFIRAASIILKERHEVRFLVVGGGFRLPVLKELAQSLGIGRSIAFTDYILHRRMPGILAHADICVAAFEDNPITRSKSPLKIVEYMSMQKPIVASNVGEVPQMLDNCGSLVPPGDERAIATAIDELLSNPEKRNQLGKRARQRILDYYNWEAGAKTLITAYERCLDRD